MWYLKLSKGEKIRVRDDKLENVKTFLSGNGLTYIDLNGNFIKRSHIMGLFEEGLEDDLQYQIRDERNVKIIEMSEDWKNEQLRLSSQPIDMKVNREFNCKTKIRWFLRAFNYDIPKDKEELIKAEIKKYFEKNTDEAWADPKSYQALLPFQNQAMHPLQKDLQSIKI